MVTEIKNSQLNWFKKHWIVSIFLIFILFGMIGSIFEDTPNENIKVDAESTNSNLDNTIYLNSNENAKADKTYGENVIEIKLYDFIDTFEDLSDLQQSEKINGLKGKRFKTTISAYKISKASLSTQYVVMDDDLGYYEAKVFFPNEEKEKLLRANIGDEITFSGEFVTYNAGYTHSYVEFTNSKVLDIKSKI